MDMKPPMHILRFDDIICSRHRHQTRKIKRELDSKWHDTYKSQLKWTFNDYNIILKEKNNNLLKQDYILTNWIKNKRK